MSVFENLNLKQLSIAGLVNKRWSRLSKLTWLCKTSLKFSDVFDLEDGQNHLDYNRKLITFLNQNNNLANLKSVDITEMPDFLLSTEILLDLLAKNSLKIMSIKISYHKCAIIQPENLGALLGRFSNLNRLDLCLSFLDSQHLSVVLKQCVNLEFLRFRMANALVAGTFTNMNSKKLRELCIDFSFGLTVGENEFAHLFKKCTNLKKLILKDCGKNSELNIGDLIAGHLTQIEVLNVSFMYKNFENFSKLKHLSELSLDDKNLTNDQFAHILNKCECLKNLTLNKDKKRHRLDANAFTILPIKAPIQFLNVSRMISSYSLLDGKAIRAIATQMSKLNILNLSDENFFSSEDLCFLLDACTDLFGLILLNIEHNYKIFDHNVLEKVHSLKSNKVNITIELSWEELSKFFETKADRVKNKHTFVAARARVLKFEIEFSSYRISLPYESKQSEIDFLKKFK